MGAVAGGNVKKPVLAELEIAAVVTAGQKGKKDLLALGITTRGIAFGDAKARDARAVRQLLAVFFAIEDIANVAIMVFGELGMEGQAVEVADSFYPGLVPAMQLGA